MPAIGYFEPVNIGFLAAILNILPESLLS